MLRSNRRYFTALATAYRRLDRIMATDGGRTNCRRCGSSRVHVDRETGAVTCASCEQWANESPSAGWREVYREMGVDPDGVGGRR